MPVTVMLNSSRTAQRIWVRGLLLFCGFFGAAWSVLALPSFRLAESVRDMSTRIIAGQNFKLGPLSDMSARIESAPQSHFLHHPDIARADALISISSADNAMQRATSTEVGTEKGSAISKLRGALSANPSDSFLWFLLYSTSVAQTGFDAAAFQYLRRSYASGPHEGWIALERNKQSLATFNFLDSVTQDLVVAEFAEMVDADFIEDTASNLLGAGWSQKDRLAAALGNTNVVFRKALYNRLAYAGIKLRIPGIEYDERPWR